VLAITLATTLQIVAPAAPSSASGSRLQEEVAIAARQAQQIQLPTIDCDPKKWAKDAISAVLQDLGDGIRSGMDALWAANFITQTPPSLTWTPIEVGARPRNVSEQCWVDAGFRLNFRQVLI